jgi:hypothetical protein
MRTLEYEYATREEAERKAPIDFPEHCEALGVSMRSTISYTGRGDVWIAAALVSGEQPAPTDHIATENTEETP